MCSISWKTHMKLWESLKWIINFKVNVHRNETRISVYEEAVGYIENENYIHWNKYFIRLNTRELVKSIVSET